MRALRILFSVVAAVAAVPGASPAASLRVEGEPAPAAPTAPWSLREVEARALPSLAEAEARARIAAAESELAGTRSRLREGATVAFEAGPRRSAGSDGSAGSNGSNGANRADAAAEIDLPLTPASAARGRLRAAIDGTARALLSGARAVARLRREELYLDVWLAQRSAAIREADLATVERWLGAAKARLEAGADPPFELTLVEGERLRAQLDLAAARRDAAVAWGELATLAAGLPPAPPPLADPEEGGPPPPGGPGADLAALAASPRALAAEARLELSAARADLAQTLELSPWSLRGSIAREGLDTFGRLGVAYKIPLRGEPQAVRRRYAAELDAERRARDQEARSLASRLATARDALASLPPGPAPLDLERAIAAVELRLTEGKERPSEALPLRRQLLEARLSGLRSEHLRLRLLAEVRTLTAPLDPSDSTETQDGQP